MVKPQRNTRFYGILWLCILLIGNTLSFFNELRIFSFEYSNIPESSNLVKTTLIELLNGYDYSSFWQYFNLTLISTLVSQLMLFLLISLQLAEHTSTHTYYYSVSALVFPSQLFLIFKILWPFSAHSSYGQGFEARKTNAITMCQGQEEVLQSCQFIETLFYALDCFKILTILIFICLAGLAASTIDLKKSNDNKSQILQGQSTRISQNIPVKSDQTIKDSRVIDINKLNNNVFIEQKLMRKQKAGLASLLKIRTQEQQQCTSLTNSLLSPVKAAEKRTGQNQSFKGLWSNSFISTQHTNSSDSNSDMDISRDRIKQMQNNRNNVQNSLNYLIQTAAEKDIQEEENKWL